MLEVNILVVPQFKSDCRQAAHQLNQVVETLKVVACPYPFAKRYGQGST